MAIRQQALGAAHPDLAASMISLARSRRSCSGTRAARSRSRTARSPSPGAFFPAESYEVGAARLVRGQALIALDRGAEARTDMEAVLDTFERVLGPRSPVPRRSDDRAGPGRARREREPADAQGLLERAWEIRSTHTADGGVREQTAFSLAQAIWDAAPADRKHALELATEARDGYADLPDMAPAWRWSIAGSPAATCRAPARPVGSASSSPAGRTRRTSDELEPAPM